MTSTETPAVDNGVNVGALLGAREHLTAAPDAAKFQWRATCEWLNGTHSRSTVTGFSGLGQEHSHRQEYSFDADHPELFASQDNGATPPEMVLAALASCLTAGVASVATNRGVQLRSVTATIEGGMDIQGILGIDSDVRNGFDEIRVSYAIDADASTADIEAIVAQSQKRSAVFDIVSNPTTIQVEVV
ncbi:hypothetical protein BH23ACT3_BH23ACT3_09620 [soil metagenome]